MASLNKVLLIGNLGADPEIKYVGSDSVTLSRMRLATTERSTDKNGAAQEVTTWHSLVAWRRLAEYSRDYLKKGSQIFVEGKLSTNTWTDTNNVKHYRTEVVCDRIMGLGKREDASFNPDDARKAAQSDKSSFTPQTNEDEEDYGPDIEDYGGSVLNPLG
jgi:single-strand DNA-binding protein